jgi:hypothetical protein
MADGGHIHASSSGVPSFEFRVHGSGARERESVLDCGSLLPLCSGGEVILKTNDLSRFALDSKSGRGLPQSKTWRRFAKRFGALVRVQRTAGILPEVQNGAAGKMLAARHLKACPRGVYLR